ncbi:MAG: AGE family epimerase/isomerase [Hyphomonadaceae bacterium]|nr:AGE family epimerase/isomerase [Hyphomonadaceae bacterium]
MSSVPFAAARAWLFDAALPFWAERGVDRIDGGFYEELGADGRPTDCDFKRVRVICRQIYVFSHAASLGWAPGAAISEWGYKYLVTQARLRDGGWARKLTRRGAVADATVDLYELAFVIFAMAWRFRVSGDQEARTHAIETLSFIRDRMRAPNGGFWHTLPLTFIRSQNPHMHLAEACLAGFEATGEEVFLDTAREIVQLFATRFFDPRTLGERFDQTWERVGGGVEPGHHFEWTWILAHYQRLTGDTVASLAARSSDFAERHGVDPETRAVYDALNEDGSVLRSSSRLWPNTERMKAALGLFELDGRDPRGALASSTDLIFGRYFAGNIPGLWTDQFDGDGKPMTTTTPASCVYHLFMAFSEMLRLETQIAKL